MQEVSGINIQIERHNFLSSEFASAPNRETLEAIEEVRRMEKNPSLGKSYTDIDQMMKELLA